MRDFYSSLYTLLLKALMFCGLLVSNHNVIAQCAECTPDSSCMSTDGFPLMCPLIPPDATVNNYYSENITFYLPTLVNDPGSGLTVTLQEVEITSIAGLPFGLALTFNNDDNVFMPSSGENFGCATVCGTPLIPGTYQVSINANVSILVAGFETSIPQSFSTTLTVIAAEGQTNSFTFDQSAGCGSVEVDFNASYSAPSPSITTYEWTFGNGTTSSLANPENILFDTPNSYVATLTTTISIPTIDQISITGLSNAWSGDIEENSFLGGLPDVYFQLINGDTTIIFTSESIANNEAPAWVLSPISLNEPPYTLVFYDEDPVSADDFLGEFNIALNPGSLPFGSSNGTSGTLEIGQLITTQITDSTIIQVFPLPNSTLTLNNNIATVADPNFSSILWFQDGELTDEFIASTAALTTGGVYSAQVTNVFGCTANTNEVVYCAPVTIEYIPAAQELYVSETFSSYQWYFNGVAIKGGDNYYITTNEPGNYSVTVTTDYGCVTESGVYILIISVEEQENTLINLFPIPARELINVQLTTPAPWAITDITGRTIMANLSVSSVFTINIESLPVGVYFLQANESRVRFVKE
jgi:hypothetical protein